MTLQLGSLKRIYLAISNFSGKSPEQKAEETFVFNWSCNADTDKKLDVEYTFETLRKDVPVINYQE